eukprot:TRINITY_DN1847_c0_g4_i1.p1 TRINITY_DN1847_c0_g4~~TRINITY_DN1847_c0_g4_i1.p1  ORF type:complete len:443 (+),score=116.17 TRINITY_DN1847_c0_g4_i1:282-1610(+)
MATPIPALQDLTIKTRGERIGPDDFIKVKLVGRGDVGKVYLCRLKPKSEEKDPDADEEEDEPEVDYYAMKILKKQDMIKRNKVKRVMTEREILATADHPFIVTLHYSFQSENKLFFIMDYCAGGEFFRTLQRQPGRRLSEDAARFYAAEVLMALEYLHMMGFIYRDLKPENILMHASGHIMLTDFDLSKQAQAVQPRMVKKSFSFSKEKDKKQVGIVPDLVTNSFVGTEEYIAPEVITGYGHTGSVDWWTFGILLFEMLCGHTPFRGRNRDQTFAQIMKGGIDWPSTVNVTKDCKNIIRKLLNADPKKRLGSVHGASDIKDHPWFKSKVNWALIRHETPPIMPKLKDITDTSNFRSLKDDESADQPEESEVKSEDLASDNPFVDFHRVDKKVKSRTKGTPRKTKSKSRKKQDSSSSSSATTTTTTSTSTASSSSTSTSAGGT